MWTRWIIHLDERWTNTSSTSSHFLARSIKSGCSISSRSTYFCTNSDVNFNLVDRILVGSNTEIFFRLSHFIVGTVWTDQQCNKLNECIAIFMRSLNLNNPSLVASIVSALDGASRWNRNRTKLKVRAWWHSVQSALPIMHNLTARQSSCHSDVRGSRWFCWEYFDTPTTP